jgi:hypothetical protein
VLCWPSRNPHASNAVYNWYEPGYSPDHVVAMDGPPVLGEVAELPAEWVEGLKSTSRAKGGSPKARVTEGTVWGEVPFIIECCLTAGRMTDKVAQCLGEAIAARKLGRHDADLSGSAALLRYGKKGHSGVFEAMSALMRTFVNEVTRDGSRTERDAEDEFMRMLSNPKIAELLSEGDEDGDSEKNDGPKRWAARDLEAPKQPQWLAKQRLPRGSVSLLVGDEGIGKSLLAILVIAHVTTGKPFAGFGIPAREPGRVLLVLTEDDWRTEVRPRLEVAGADLDMVEVICTDKDGSGSPVFPRDIELIAGEPHPVLVVVDCWLDTVPSSLQVREPQGARQALHPWKDVGTRTNAAIWLLCHTNRVASARARDKYGVTSELRKKARLTVYCQSDEDGNPSGGPGEGQRGADRVRVEVRNQVCAVLRAH